MMALAHKREASFRFNTTLRYREENHPQQTQLTPEYVLEPIKAILGEIELDPCTTSDNPVGAKRFYCPPQDGLALPWDAKTIFVNPPYGEARIPWVKRCVKVATLTGTRIVVLIPSATDTMPFQTAAEAATTVLFWKGRIRFSVPVPSRETHSLQASHPSVIFGLNVDLRPMRRYGYVCERAA